MALEIGDSVGSITVPSIVAPDCALFIALTSDSDTASADMTALEKSSAGRSDIEDALADLKRSAAEFDAAVRRLAEAVSAKPRLAGRDPGVQAARAGPNRTPGQRQSQTSLRPTPRGMSQFAATVSSFDSRRGVVALRFEGGYSTHVSFNRARDPSLRAARDGRDRRLPRNFIRQAADLRFL
jgi:hypothetical protein